MKFQLSIQQKRRLGNYFPNLSLETIFMNIEHCKINKLEKLGLNLSQRLDLKNSNKHVTLQKLFITHTKIQDSSTKTINSK